MRRDAVIALVEAARGDKHDLPLGGREGSAVEDLAERNHAVQKRRGFRHLSEKIWDPSVGLLGAFKDRTGALRRCF